MRGATHLNGQTNERTNERTYFYGMAGRDGAASASMRSTLLRDLLTFTIYLYVSHMRYVVSALGNINVTGLATSVSMSDSVRVG